MKPLLLSTQEWSRLQKWTKHGEEDPETVRKKEYIKYLDDTSKEMTKAWPNSFENYNKRNEEARRMRIEAVEQANSKFYKRYVKRQKQEQEKLMYNARDTIFKNKDAPKLLLSAVIETAIQKEREEQVKFQKKLREREIEKKRKEDEEVIRKAQEWNDKKRLNHMQRDINKQHQKEIVEQARDLAERQRKEREEEIQREKLDIVMADRELEALKEFEEERKRKEKAQILQDMMKSKAEVDKRRREQDARDKMDDRLQEVLVRSRDRIEKKRRDTEKQERDNKLRILEEISKSLQSGDAERDAKEQASLEKAVKERNAALEEKHLAQLAKQAQLRLDRQNSRQQYLRDEEQRLHELDTTLRWQMINRYKNQEIYGDYLDKIEQEKQRKIKQFREDVLKQWKEREDLEAQQLAEKRYFYGELAEKKLREDDNKVLSHAAALLEEARLNGRPTLPIEKAIDRYCRMYRLYGMPDLPDSLQEHFPRPKSPYKPDLQLQNRPEPPPIQQGDDDSDDDDDERNGLQELLKKKTEKAKESQKPTSAPAPPPPTRSAPDYKRQGPANGLQQKEQAASESKLPKIKVLQCFASYPTFNE